MQPTSTASNPLFDRDFLLATMMGPNCVRFAEELTANIPFSPNMRVLDLGCGMGLSSIYLARTFGVRVFAADLWINPSDNFARFRDFGLEDAVIPLRAEGHALPFAEGYFDAVICIDAYHFFDCQSNLIYPFVSEQQGVVNVHSTNNNSSLEVHHGYAVQAHSPHGRLRSRRSGSWLLCHEGNVKTFTNKWYGEQTCLPSPP